MKRLIYFVALIVLTTIPALCDQSTPEGAVSGFYDWYQKAGFKYRDKFAEARPYFTDELYGLLSDGFEQSTEAEFWVDFDPFVNAQMDAQKISVGKPATKAADLAVVPVVPFYGEGHQGEPIKVWVKKVGGEWKIANLAYAGDYPFELKKYLKDGLHR